MITICEIKIDDRWIPVGVDDAYATYFAGARKRCPRCHGALHLYPGTKGSSASVAHFGHNVAHSGCPTMKHPHAVE